MATRINYDISCVGGSNFSFLFLGSILYGVVTTGFYSTKMNLCIRILTVKLFSIFFFIKCVKKNMFEQKIKIIYAKIPGVLEVQKKKCFFKQSQPN